MRLGSHQVADQAAERRSLYLGVGCLAHPDDLIRFATNKATESSFLTEIILPFNQVSQS